MGRSIKGNLIIGLHKEFAALWGSPLSNLGGAVKVPTELKIPNNRFRKAFDIAMFHNVLDIVGNVHTLYPHS